MEAQSLDIWSILIIIGLAQGVFVLSVMAFKGQLKERQHVFLFALLLTIIWLQLEFLSIRFPYNVELSIFYGTRYGSWLILGPLYFLYIKSASGITVSSKQVLLHLSPFLVLAIIGPMVLGDILNFRQVHYGMLTPFDDFEQQVSSIQYFYSGIFILQYVHFLAYLITTSSYLRRHENILKQQYSSYQDESYRWVKVTSVLMYLVFLFSTAFLAILFYTKVYRRHLDYVYVLPMAALIYLVSYKLAGVKWSKPLVKEEPKKYHKSSLKPQEATVLANQLSNHFDTKKPYLNNELRLQDIASDVNIPPHHLSQLFNQELDTTFFDFVNKKRVIAAQQLIQENPEASLLQISFDSGFNNKTSFVNAFKKHAGMTPSAYRKQFVLV